MQRYYCTYFDRNYLSRAIALFHSLNRFERNSFTIFAVCLDEISRLLLTKLQIPNVTVVPFHDIEKGDESLLQTKNDRTEVEYYWTATPTIILRLLEQNPHIDILTYLDSDLFFFSSPDQIYDELGDGSALIHPHRFPEKHKEYEVAGLFNVGLLSFRSDHQGFKILNDWREKCIEWCYHKIEADRFGDQKYLDAWPARFSGLVISQHPGIGTAPWNQEQYFFQLADDGTPLVDGKELVFFHFHNLKIINAGVFKPIANADYCLNREILTLCYLPYIKEVSRAILILQQVLSNFNFGQAPSSEIGIDDTFLIHESLVKQLGELGLPQKQLQLDCEWTCFAGRQVYNENPVVTPSTVLPMRDGERKPSV